MTAPELSLEAFTAAAHQLAPEVAIVLGSGLGSLLERVEVTAELPFTEVPGLPASTVPGHAGRFVLGRLGAARVLVSAGRVHLYEGHTAAEVTLPVRFMADLGVRTLVLTNAAGTLHPDFPPGTWMMISDHLNLTGTSPLTGGPHFVDMSAAWDAELRARFSLLAGKHGMPLHSGVYAGLPGPQYETPAEVRMLRTLGADAVGMSTVLEAIQARALGLRLAGFSCLTNWAAGLAPGGLSHAEVIDTGRAAAAQLVTLLADWLGEK